VTSDPPDLAQSGLKAVLFDLGGVVTRTARVHAQGPWKQLFDEFLARRSGEPGELRPFRLPDDDVADLDGKPGCEGVQSLSSKRAASSSPGRS